MTLTNFNATTPQSKVVENIFKAVAARDIKSVEPFLSKDLKAETFPKIASLPDVSKALSLERYGTIISLFTKIEVRNRDNLRTRRLRSSIPRSLFTN